MADPMKCQHCKFIKTKGFLFSDQLIKTFSCSCLGEEGYERICEDCKDKCHSNTPNNPIHFIVEKKETKISKFICACTTRSKTVPIVDQKDQSTCVLSKEFTHDNNFFCEVESDNFEEGENPKMVIICAVCFLFCQKRKNNENDKPVKLTTVKNTGRYECECNKSDHQSLIGYYKKLKNLFERPLINTYSDRINFWYIFNAIKSTYRVEFQNFEDQFKNNFKKNKFSNKNALQSEDRKKISQLALLLILKFGSKVLGESVYPFGYLTKILNLNYQSLIENFDLKKKMNSLSFEIKILVLKCYKNFLILPKIKNNFLRIILEKNITPLHRLLFSFNKEGFFKTVGIQEDQYKALIQLIIDTIKKYSDDITVQTFYQIFFNLTDIFQLLLCCLDLEIEYILKIFEEIKTITILLMDKKQIEENQLNDNESNFNDDKNENKEGKEGLDSKIENSENIKNSQQTIKKTEKVGKDKNKKQEKKVLGKRFKTFLRKMDDLIEISLLKINDIKIFDKLSSVNFKDKEVNFKPDEKGIKLNEILAFLSNFPKDKNRSSLKFINIFSSNNDFYSRSLKNLSQSRIKFLKEDQNLIAQDEDDFKRVITEIEKFQIIFEEKKEKYLNSHMKNESEEDLEINLLSFFEQKIFFEIKNIINNCKQFNNKNLKITLQYILYKHGYFDLVINIFNFCFNNKYFCTKLLYSNSEDSQNPNNVDEDQDNLSERKQKILGFFRKGLNIIKLIVTENVLTSSLIFTQFYIKNIFFDSLHFTHLDVFKLFENLLKFLKKHNYRLDFTPYVEKILKNFEIRIQDDNTLSLNNPRKLEKESVELFQNLKWCFIVNLKEEKLRMNILTGDFLKNFLKNSDFINESLDFFKNSEKNKQEDVKSNSKFVQGIIDLVNLMNIEIFDLISYQIRDMIPKPDLSLLDNPKIPRKVVHTIIYFWMRVWFGNKKIIDQTIREDYQELLQIIVKLTQKDHKFIKIVQEKDKITKFETLKIFKSMIRFYFEAIFYPSYTIVYQLSEIPNKQKKQKFMAISIIKNCIKLYQIFLEESKIYLGFFSENLKDENSNKLPEIQEKSELQHVVKKNAYQSFSQYFDFQFRNIYDKDQNKEIDFSDTLFDHIDKELQDEIELIKMKIEVLKFEDEVFNANYKDYLMMFLDRLRNINVDRKIIYLDFKGESIFQQILHSYQSNKKDPMNSQLSLIFGADNIIQSDIEKNIIETIIARIKENDLRIMDESPELIKKLLIDREASKKIMKKKIKFKTLFIDLNDQKDQLEMICLILKTNPKFSQKIIKKFLENKKEIRQDTNKFFEIYFNKTDELITMIFESLSTQNSAPSQRLGLLDLRLEFLKLLCSKNNSFQTLLLNIKIESRILELNEENKTESRYFQDLIEGKEEGSKNLFFLTDIILLNLIKIFHLIKNQILDSDKVKGNIMSKQVHINRFIDILSKFLTSMLQDGRVVNFKKNFCFNLESNSKMSYLIRLFKGLFVGSHFIPFNYYHLTYKFFRFLNGFIEEPIIPIENKLDLLRNINYEREILKTLVNIISKRVNTLNHKNHITINEYLTKCYLGECDLMDKELFIFSNELYIFIKYTSRYSVSETFKQIFEEVINRVNLYDETNGHNSFSQFKNEDLDIFSFFEKITKTVEISFLPNKSSENFSKIIDYRTLIDHHNEQLFTQIEESEKNMKDKPIIIPKIFTKNKLSDLYIFGDLRQFIFQESPLDKVSLKLDYFRTAANDIHDVYKTREFMLKWNFMGKIIHSINIINKDYLINISAGFAVLINLFLLLSLKNVNNQIIGNMDNLIFTISFIHQIFLAFIVLNFVVFNYLKSVKIKKSWETKLKYKEIISDLLPEESFILILNFVLGQLGMSISHMVYSFQLFSIFYLSTTMKAAIITVKMKYGQFLSTILLIVLISLFFASIGFYYFNDLYFHEQLNENMCDSLFHCFLTIFSYSFINGSVDFSYLKSINDERYWIHFMFSWMYYFLISIIMVNIINAIIVNTFQEIRENENSRVDFMSSVCYICSLNKSKFQIHGIEFQKHIEGTHNCIVYIDYFMKIKEQYSKDPDNIENHIDRYVYGCLRKNKTIFIPVNQSLDLETKKKKKN